MFAYCNNDPVNLVDPSGHIPKWLRDAADWGKENIIQPIVDFFEDLIEDSTVEKDNESEETVLESNYYSYYKGTLVIKLPIGYNAAYYGVIFLGDSWTTENGGKTVVKHEGGHAVQMEAMGWADYTTFVAIPSVTCNLLQRAGKLTVPYYSLPWEYQADKYGGVEGRRYAYWARDVSVIYYTAIENLS